jgi:DnaJ-class molecular chaperone
MAKLRVWIAAACLAGATLTAAPQAPASHQRASNAPVAKTSTKPKLSDSQLEAAIRAKFAKSKINEDKFTVRVQGGVATIDGKTNVVQHKGVATRMSKTAGALAVNNRVQVSDEARKKAAGNLDEGRRRAQVKREDTRSERK